MEMEEEEDEGRELRSWSGCCCGGDEGGVGGV